MKYLSFARLLTFDLSVLYRMRNCLRYWHTLCEQTQSDIIDILYESTWVY